MTPENWNQVVQDSYTAIGWVAVPYFLLLFLLGYYIVKTLFLVIMLSNFESSVPVRYADGESVAIGLNALLLQAAAHAQDSDETKDGEPSEAKRHQLAKASSTETTDEDQLSSPRPRLKPSGSSAEAKQPEQSKHSNEHSRASQLPASRMRPKARIMTSLGFSRNRRRGWIR